jgi:pyruvate-formate lyase-activating enzyme
MDQEKINQIIRITIRFVKRKFLELHAATTGKRFYCLALSGESDSSIAINCDMTVSCNCKDYDGTGHIGDLNSQSFEEVFGSPKANQFRRRLASGKLAIPTCASCSELRPIDAEKADQYVENWHIPKKGIMVENTVACSYRCKSCSRMLVSRTRKAKRMSLSDIQKIATIIQKHKINHICFLNLGDPFAAPDVYDQLRIIREKNPNVSILTSTNGILLDTDVKRDAALLVDHIDFSIDGINDYTMRKYQRGASFYKAYDNMKALVEYRNKRGKIKPRIEWKYILFNWNDRKKMVQQAIEMARSANVDIISFVPTNVPVYGISWRYHFKKFYKSLGETRWKGRQVCFVNAFA